jgi:hypothetical protein
VFVPRKGRYRDRRRDRRRPYQQHGLTSLRETLREHGLRALDPRSPVVRALRAWRTELVADLGGAERLSTQQQTLVDLAAKVKLMLDSIDVWLLGQRSLVSGRLRSVYPVVRERTQLAEHLARLLSQLGLARATPPSKDLGAYLAERYGPGAAPAAEAPRGDDA